MVELPTYKVLIEPGAIMRLPSLVGEIEGVHRVAVVTDSHVAPLYANRLVGALSNAALFTIPAGETAKTRETWATLTDGMLASGYGRDSLIVAVGGGVV